MLADWLILELGLIERETEELTEGEIEELGLTLAEGLNERLTDCDILAEGLKLADSAKSNSMSFTIWIVPLEGDGLTLLLTLGETD